MKVTTMIRRMAAHARREHASSVSITAFADGRVRVVLKDPSGTRAAEVFAFEMRDGWHVRIPRKVKAIFKKRGPQ